MLLKCIRLERVPSVWNFAHHTLYHRNISFSFLRLYLSLRYYSLFRFFCIFFFFFCRFERTHTHTHAEPQRAVSYLSIGDPSLCFVRKTKCYRIVFQFHRCNKWWYNTCGEPCIPALTPFLSCTSRSCIFNVRSLPTYDAELCYYSFPFVYLPMTADKCYSSCSNIAAISAITRISHESIVPRIRSST